MKNKKWLNYLLAFLIPSIVLVVIYACVGIYPFGKKSLLTVDLAGQYVAFFNALKNIFSGDISIFYSFSKTLGGNMFGLLTYYLLSPFNLLFVLFNRINITEAIFLINILKIGCAGLTSCIYFSKTFKKKDFSVVIFSIVYALTAYNIVYSQNLMWLDGVIFLPLVFLGIDKLIEQDKPVMFYLMLTCTIFVNYYIGYMTCIGSLCYFLYKLYLHNDCKLSWKNNKDDIIKFFKYALLSVGTTMVVLLPSLFSLLVGKAGAGLSEFIPKQTYPIIELISRLFLGSFTAEDLAGGCPNIYISLFMIILVIIYFFNKKISKQDKLGTLILVLFFIISFTFYSVDLVWHTFQHPAGFPFRYSFIFDFILLIIAYKSYLNIDGVDKKIFKYMIPITAIIVLLMDKLMYTTSMYYKIIGTGVLIVGYLLYLKHNSKIKFGKLLSTIIILEMSLNSLLIVVNMDYQERKLYTDFIGNYGSIINSIKNNDTSKFYRIEKDYSYTTNDPLLLNYNGLSHFSSTYEGQNNTLLGDYLGIFNRFYITNYHGSTMVTNSLFNVKYVLLNDEVNYYNKVNQYQTDTDNIYLYENQYSLPLGFMVNSKIKDVELTELQPFKNQNIILNNLSGIEKNVFYKNDVSLAKITNLKEQKDAKGNIVYTRIVDENDVSLKYQIKVLHDGEQYLYISSNYSKKIDVLVNNKSVIDTSDQNDYRYNILDLGEYKNGDVIDIDIIFLDDRVKLSGIMSYSFNLNSFKDQISALNSNQSFNIDKYSIDYISGNIEVTKDNQIMYTSIPYDKGWTIKVDGKQVKPLKLLDSLIGIELSKGSHTIEFSYMPSGLYVGGLISLVSFILLLICLFRKKK